jgi:hypothetical protein
MLGIEWFFVSYPNVRNIVQFHPALGYRLKPEYQEWFDVNIRGRFKFDEDRGIYFSREQDAAIFKLTFVYAEASIS